MGLDRLKTQGKHILDAQGKPVRLRGVGIGGWMNLENFINGYPGAEFSLREAFNEILGPSRTQFYFERLLDYVLAEDDIRWIKAQGATAIRLPFNYRHLESDAAPFQYLEAGFARLDKVLDWCAQYELYAILDLHAAAGYQNPDWHADNSSGHALLWQHPHFQDRFIALWQALAQRYRGRKEVAAYDMLNEPVTRPRSLQFEGAYQADWQGLNALYQRVVKAIRSVDQDTIIILEGDAYASVFDGLEAPAESNLVYSSHHYLPPCFGPGAYPGRIQHTFWTQECVRRAFFDHQGTRYCETHAVPQWIGEFGAMLFGPEDERSMRLQCLKDQLGSFEAKQAHWSQWTYKDIGIMGWVVLDPRCEYLERIRPVLEAKHDLGTDVWTSWIEAAQQGGPVDHLMRWTHAVMSKHRMPGRLKTFYMEHALLCDHIGTLLQPEFARCFQGLTEKELDRVLRSFALDNCQINKPVLAILPFTFQERA